MSNPHQTHQLSAIAIHNLKTPGAYLDGGGLYLLVTDTGSKRWVLRMQVNGKRRELGLGPLAKVPLKNARERAAEMRAQLFSGLDPVAERKRARTPAKVVVAPTFETCAHEVHRLRKAHMRNAKRRVQWIRQLETYAFPTVGTKPINEVTTADCMAILSPIWPVKRETARRIRQRLHNILDWARASGHRTGDNPVDLIGEALPKRRKRVRHFAALPYVEVAAFIAALRAGNADLMSKLAFEFLILTAARTGEVRFARRTELDLPRALWTIPAYDEATNRGMKMEREHIVPLSPRAVAIVEQALALYPKGDLIFPDRASGQAMSENRFLIARDALGYGTRCTPHGFRSSFRDWAAEETSFPAEVADMALAHAIKDEAEAAYRRGMLLAKRRDLMLAWADYIRPPTEIGAQSNNPTAKPAGVDRRD